ncbi:ribonuclease H-like domain-containing protein [Caldithrix abyssi]
MDLKKKLQYYRQVTERSSDKKETVKAASKVPASVKALAAHFNGRLLEYPTPIVEITYSMDAEETAPQIFLDRLTKGQFAKPIDLAECLFFDLETTGLSGGAGTYPFLLGFGFYEAKRFKVVQYFLPDFGRDYYAFKEIIPLLEGKSILISFNGKSYDFPLLKTRAILNRFTIDLDRFRHLDLLHLSRRVWKDSQESCDLVSIEREQLNIRRSGDIPGYLIPAAYLRFIRNEVIHEMIAVIQHNRQDIISLNKILFRLSSINQSPEALNDGKALMRLAKLAFEINDYDYFVQVEKQLLKIRDEHHPEFKLLLSFFLKKQGNWQKACALWESLVAHQSYSFVALEELAKAHEHVFKDYQKALEYSARALKMYGTLQQLNPYSVKSAWKTAFLQRYERLKCKIS